MSMWSHPPWMVRANSMSARYARARATPISFASTASTRLTPQSRLLLADVRDLEDLDMPVRDIGRRVVDERHGELGEIREVIETAAHDVWVIDGPHGEVLVPVVDEVIVAYPDDDDGVIRTRVMDGLLES